MSITSTNINPGNVDINQARAIAIDFIKPYVERGDNVEQIMEGGMCEVSRDDNGDWYHVQCGDAARVFDQLHHFNHYRVIVTQIKKVECIIQFDVHDLIAEIKQPVKQQTLF